MKVLFIDPTYSALALALRAKKAGHEVKVWQPRTKSGEPRKVGQGMIDKVEEWRRWMGWAEIIIPTDNAYYIDDLEPFFKQKYPIFGANRAGGKLELDRCFGQEILQQCGIKVSPYEEFTSYDKAIKYVKETGKAYVSKPMGDTDKALSYVGKTPADLVYKMERWKAKDQLKMGFILQQLVKGEEVAVGGWFGPGGWSKAICMNWEEKRLMNDGLGCNTGEQGTVLHYTTSSKLFDDTLALTTEYLHSINYVGYVDLNCIVDEKGDPIPLEWTTRFGWPLVNIQAFLHEGDPIEWMADLIEGRDSLRTKKEVAVGVVMSHGDYPSKWLTQVENEGSPIYGLTPRRLSQVAFVDVMRDIAPLDVGGEVEDVETYCTAGNYILVGVGLGKSVVKAQEAAYGVMWDIDLPSNRMFRTDIGDRLEDDLVKLKAKGYCEDIKFE